MLNHEQFRRARRPVGGVESRQATVYRVSREVPNGCWDSKLQFHQSEQQPTIRQTKTFLTADAAYRQLARWHIQVRRERYTDEEGLCVLCALTEPRHGYDYEDPALCRYHDDESYHRLEKRLARWLRWRDAWLRCHPMAAQKLARKRAEAEATP